jgi:hypothetical protein
MDGTDIGQISSALGAGPIIPLVNMEGALTASGYFSLWATLYFPNSKNATDRETLAARMMADCLSRREINTPWFLMRLLLERGALGKIDGELSARWDMGLNAGRALRWVWALAYALPSEASLRTAWHAMCLDQRPARSWEFYRNAWTEMRYAAHFWAAIDQRVTVGRRSDGPVLQRLEMFGYTAEIDLNRLVQEAEAYRAFLEGCVRLPGYAPSDGLTKDISSIWRVPPCWQPTITPNEASWPPTGLPLIRQLSAALVSRLKADRNKDRPHRKRSY